MLPSPEGEPEHKHKTNPKPYIIFGVVTILSNFGMFSVWVPLAEITSGAIAPGVIAVQSEWRTIQHLEGGIVKEILVRESDQVKAGDVLIRLDETSVQAQSNIIDGDRGAPDRRTQRSRHRSVPPTS